jgi:diguanylate cyclase (GGDEF)-like protein
MRHAPHDRGGVLDAALIGLGIAAPVWEFILRPRLLANGASLPSQAVVLVQILVLLAVLGALLRISRTSERGQTALRYLFAALACTIVGLVLSGATTDPETGRQLPLVGVLWIWGYLFLAAAGLHPSAAYFVVPSGWRATAPGGIRLGHLGLVLLLNPIIGGVPQLSGGPPDGLLLSFGQLMTIPLVLTRIGQMMRQRAHDQQLLVEQATRDHLTGLANRRHLFEQLDGAVRRHAEGFGPAVTLLFCDLDDFKPVNDRWGHDAGDHVLRVVAQRLVACVRAGDVVGRIGGDEFLVLCPGAGPDEAARLRERITLALVEPVTWRGRSIHVGVTIGLATSAGTAVSADTLVAAADAQMYARKRANKVRPAEYVATRSPA